MTENILAAQNEAQFETLIQGLLNEKFGLCEHFLDEATVSGLRKNLLDFLDNDEMYPAGIGRKFDFQKNTQIRGDVIRWIDKNSVNPHERYLLNKIDHFIRYLNHSCYTSINDCEFHYAYYEENSFYKRHLDTFKSDRGRKFSLVMYLNENWKLKDGGAISLFVNEDKPDVIFPLAGRTVFFRSDEVEHEVSPSINRYRISIAGWMKSV